MPLDSSCASVSPCGQQEVTVGVRGLHKACLRSAADKRHVGLGGGIIAVIWAEAASASPQAGGSPAQKRGSGLWPVSCVEDTPSLS